MLPSIKQMAPNHCQSSTYINDTDIPQTRKNTAPDNPEFLLMMNIKINIGAPIRDPKGTNPADVLYIFEEDGDEYEEAKRE